jgi:DtxR family Mn-dependent transcriptional regulator
MHRLSARMEDYLTTIYRVREALGVVRVVDIARELHVSYATTSKILEKLEKQSLVKRVKYHYVDLTETGREIAEKVIRKHRIAEQFLVKTLGLNDLESHYYAHYLEHLPDELISKIHSYLGYPTTCPHGNPIPGYTVTYDTIRLTEVNEGEECIVKRLLGELSILLEFTSRYSIRVGVGVVVVSKTSSSIKISLNRGVEVEVPRRIARLIMVECAVR